MTWGKYKEGTLLKDAEVSRWVGGGGIGGGVVDNGQYWKIQRGRVDRRFVGTVGVV